MRLVSIFSLLLVTGCMGQVKRPNAQACWVIAGAAQKDCYNTLTDYDDEGNRLQSAEPKTIDLPRGLKNLNGHLCFDPASQEELDRFRRDSVKWGRNHCK